MNQIQHVLTGDTAGLQPRKEARCCSEDADLDLKQPRSLPTANPLVINQLQMIKFGTDSYHFTS